MAIQKINFDKANEFLEHPTFKKFFAFHYNLATQVRPNCRMCQKDPKEHLEMCNFCKIPHGEDCFLMDILFIRTHALPQLVEWVQHLKQIFETK